MLQNDCPPYLRRMFSREGWIDVSEGDAIGTTGRWPNDWTLQPWRRPEGTEYINVPQDWLNLPGPDRIRLARETGARIDPDLEPAAQIVEADSIIAKYLADTLPPSAPTA